MKNLVVLLIGSLISIAAGAKEIKVAVQCGAISPVQYGTLKAPISESEWSISADPQFNDICNLAPIDKEVILKINDLVYTGEFKSIPLDKPEFSTCSEFNPVTPPYRSHYDKYNKSLSVSLTSQYGAEGMIIFESSSFDIFIDQYQFWANEQMCVLSEFK